MLFNDLCYEWLEWKKPFVKSKTYETYYGTFVNQIEPFFKKVRCSSVNEDFLDKYSVAVQTSTLNRFNRRPSKKCGFQSVTGYQINYLLWTTTSQAQIF